METGLNGRGRLAERRVAAVRVKVVSVADVKRRSGARRPADDKLRPQAMVKCRIIEPQPCKDVARKLIGRARAENIIVKRHQAGVVSGQPDLVVSSAGSETRWSAGSGRSLRSSAGCPRRDRAARFAQRSAPRRLARGNSGPPPKS